MQTKRLALRVTMHSTLMILGVYFVMQIIGYFRDNIILGISDLSALPASVFGFLGSSVLPPLLVFSVFIFFLALPLQRTERRLDAGEILSPEDLEKTRRKILGFSGFVLAVNLIGFAIGFVLQLLLQGRIAEIIRIDRLVVLISNLAGGFVYASAQSALNNMSFSHLREKLGILEIGRRKREARSTSRQVVLTALLLIYGLTFLQFNSRDVFTVQGFETRVLDGVRSGVIPADQAAATYRGLIKDNLVSFSSRSTLNVDSIPLPWERNESVADIQQKMFLLFFTFIFIIALGIQLAVSVDLRDQLTALRRRIRDVVKGGGDLRQRLRLRNMDEIGELTELINQLLDQFQAIVTRIAHSASQTREGAAAIDRVLGHAEAEADSTSQALEAVKTELGAQEGDVERLNENLDAFRNALREVSEAASTQRSFTTDTSSAMEEMASSIQSVETMTERAGALIGTLAERGEDAGKSVLETSAAISEIESAAKQVLQVLSTLNKISASTNLLSMNAAIEAAHAGEHGKGFAVVADEVRKLAETASAQTKTIQDLIRTMSQRVALGVERVEASGKVFEELVAGLQKAAAISHEISAAMKEQAAGTRSVADSLAQMVDSSQSIQSKVSDQGTRTEKMAETVSATLSRLESLLLASQRQGESMQALERSFSSVRQEVDKNLAAVEVMGKEIGRFEA